MGGEKWPVLVYGSKETKRMEDWLVQLKIVNVEEFAKGIRDQDENTSDIGVFSNMDLFLDCYEIREEDIYKLDKFLAENGMVMVYFNNFYWDEFGIGFEVKEFDKITRDEKQKVEAFCNEYNLNNPTFYAGIMGEFE